MTRKVDASRSDRALSASGDEAERAEHRPRAPQFLTLGDVRPRLVEPGGMSAWTFRAQNFVVQILKAYADVTVRREGGLDEAMVVLGDARSAAGFVTDYGSERVDGPAVVILPPGDSRLTIRAGSLLVELFSAREEGLMDSAFNSGWYEHVDPNVPPFVSGPEPLEGSALRCYRVAEVPPDPTRLGRIYRSSIGMVNFFYPEDGPRDDARLSPHAHDDFEQCTVQLEGDYVHHIRTPWGPRLADWRPDEHRMVSGLGATLIPATCIHTTQAVHDGPHQLLDLFAPPRDDWASRPGWVLNQHDYPAPVTAPAIGE